MGQGDAATHDIQLISLPLNMKYYPFPCPSWGMGGRKRRRAPLEYPLPPQCEGGEVGGTLPMTSL